MLGYGIYTYIKIGDYASFSSVPFLSGSKLLIAVGVLITIIAFLGCCGAWKLNKCMLICFIILLIIIFCCEIAAAVVGYMHRNEFKKNLPEDMKDVFDKYGESGQKGTTDGIDLLQENLKCCGITGPKDWQRTNWGKNQRDVPDSCCITKTKDCGKGTITIVGTVLNTVYKKGCEKELETLVGKYLPVIAGIAVGIIVIQFLGMIFACALLRGVQKGTYA